MRKSILSKVKVSILLLILATTFSCKKDAISDDVDPIVGKWFLAIVNDVDVSDIDCYSSSYIDSDAINITFYLNNVEDGNCVNLMDAEQELTIAPDGYKVGVEDLGITISGNTLTWAVDTDAILKFKK